MVRRAVEREIEIIGEATNRIMKIDSNLNITATRKIIATRNRVIHSYDAVDDEFIWSIVVRHLPILKNEVELLLDEK